MRHAILSLAGIATGAVAALPTPATAPVEHAMAIDGSLRPLPRPGIVMLWATWCASCAGEIKRVPSLARAAAPMPFVTLAIDPADKARRGLAAAGLSTDGAFADARDPAAVLGGWGGAGAMLPLAVAIDRAGNVCATKRGLLGTDQLQAWKTRCLR